MPDRRPYLSVVVTARNDDHGGNLLGRTQAFVNGWIAQSKRHQLPSELIFVEWNPPEERPCLVDALHWPEDLGPCQVRVVQVPPELHRRYASADALPLYQMAAKNVGIRRARGQFVLATNIDIIFSNELVGFLAERKLDPRRMYRIDRHDVMSEVPVEGIDDQLAYCRAHLIRINAREGTFNLTAQGRRALSSSDIAAMDSGIMFGPGWFPVERTSAEDNFRWATTNAELQLAPPYPGVRHLRLDIEPGPGVGSNPLEVLFMNAKGKQLAQATVYSRGILRLPVEVIAEDVPLIVRFRVLNGGRSIPVDTRILEFRVFRCDWEPEIHEEAIGNNQEPETHEETIGDNEDPETHEEAIGHSDWNSEIQEEPIGQCCRDPEIQIEPVGQLSITVGRATQPLRLWARFQRFLAMVADGEDVILVPVAVSPSVKRALKIYVDHGGITGLLRRGFKLEKSASASIAVATLPIEIPANAMQEQSDMAAARAPIEIPGSVQQAQLPTVTAAPPVEIPASLQQAQLHTIAAAPPVEIPASLQQVHLRTNAGSPPVEIPASLQQVHLHTNGCGDFTLMALENWLDLRGYPEFDVFSMHLDSIFCFSAHYSGVLEEVLEEPMRIYHIEHGTGSGWTPEGQAKLFARIAERGISMIEHRDVMRWATQIRKLRCPMIFNLKNWGLADFNLPETTVTSAFVKTVKTSKMPHAAVAKNLKSSVV